MSRKIPEKRVYNIKLYLNSCILFKSFTSDAAPPMEYSYYLQGEDGGPLVFGNQFYNPAHDTFEYFLIRKES